jgi:MinD-like ATPase involved in chromosome partitioning or flagellar assembly
VAADRYVLLGLAHVGSGWFRELARWSNSGVVPIEFAKTVSVGEVRARLAGGRPYSALVADVGVPGLDRDLLDETRQAGCAVILVGTATGLGDLGDLGVSAVLPVGFEHPELLDVLRQVAAPIDRVEQEPTRTEPAGSVPLWRGRLVAVTGRGGVGRSTLAGALAQGLAADPRLTDQVCLADLCLDADQAMLHDAPDVVPGLVELCDAHRVGMPSIEQVRSVTWDVSERGYALLLGLRRHRDWTALRPRALGAALRGLLRTFRVVVADVDPDVEGEAETGSPDVEERNVAARAAVGTAEVVVVVGRPGLQGVHALVGSTRRLLDHGVEPARVLPVINRAPRGPRARAELSAAFAALLGRAGAELPTPVFVAERRGVEEAFRDGARLPDSLCAGLTRSVQGLLASSERRVVADPDEPVAVAPGSLGIGSER